MQKNTMPSPDYKAGFVAIAGAPNVGKSTLLNRFLGQKISITSKKPQTTRNRILGVCHQPQTQIAFIDTPGIHQAKGQLNFRLSEAAVSAISDSDLVLFLIDAAAPDPVSEKRVVSLLKGAGKPALLALNKIDLIAKPRLLHLIDVWSKRFDFKAIIPISAKIGDQVEVLLQTIVDTIPHGYPFFDQETLTDKPVRFMAAEIIREKVFRLTGNEIPYSTAVTIDAFSEDPQIDRVNIMATIHVERDSQKGILIGKNGCKLKQIGEKARKDIQKLLERRLFLKLFIRVQKNWSKDTRALRKLGY